MFRRREGGVEVLLAHPGGPFWASKDRGAWTIPKGGLHRDEAGLDAAIREFHEETGLAPHGPYWPLGTVRQLSGKIVEAWAFEGDWDPAELVSIAATTEWPPRSGRYIDVPEIDRARFFPIDEARDVMNVGQVPLLDRLLVVLGAS
jgi:predicted NUDIX family NTP pyrophosphohydrolase